MTPLRVVSRFPEFDLRARESSAASCPGARAGVRRAVRQAKPSSAKRRNALSRVAFVAVFTSALTLEDSMRKVIEREGSIW